jgi:hypothetical protein
MKPLAPETRTLPEVTGGISGFRGEDEMDRASACERVDPGLTRPAAGILGMSEKSGKSFGKSRIPEPANRCLFFGSFIWLIAAIGIKKLT